MQNRPWLQIAAIAVPVALAFLSLVGMLYSTNEEVSDLHERVNRLEQHDEVQDERFFELVKRD